MKIGTLHHPKLSRLAKLLGLPRYAAAGLLEALWHLAAESADDGGVGRFSDAEIADYLGWEGDPQSLTAALVEARWLDANDPNRLAVHDWAEHCPTFIRERLKKRCQRAAKAKKSCGDGAGTSGGQPGDNLGTTKGQGGTQKGRAAESPLSSTSRHFTSNQVVDVDTVDDDDQRNNSLDGKQSRQAEPHPDEVVVLADRIERSIGTPLDPRDRELAYKAALLSLTELSEHWLWDAVEAVRCTPKRNPWAYLHRCLAEGAQKAGRRFDVLLATCDLPAALQQPPDNSRRDDRLVAAADADDRAPIHELNGHA